MSAADMRQSPDVAIVGMAGRFPDARDLATFWENLRSGHDAVRRFSLEELRAAGVDDARLANPAYVKAGTILEGVDLFDAAFFGFTPREAEMMDPQHRLLLEAAWEALENAGCAPDRFTGAIGVFASCGFATYFLHNVLTNRDQVEMFGMLPAAIGNEADSAASMLSYKLNLRGPSFTVQTFCSSSLVAVHLACQSLLNCESDVALAGGAALSLPQGTGYLYKPGGILSPDGCCRTFDARAAGSVYGSGVGVLVLKRLEDAIAQRDHIYAVVKGSAINNDGALKAGYTAPGVQGQAAVISEAMASASADPETIDYVEAHGTATPLGDSIELAALMKAFGASGRARTAIGSVKTSIGHLDRAAGVAGVIKVALALQHGELPPSLHFDTPNRDIEFDTTPFYVNTTLRPWRRRWHPRRAGVSSFGLGGTNAHVVLEEAPQREPSSASRDWQLLLLSARTPAALDGATAALAAHVRDASADLADVAYTLQVGRTRFNERRMLVCRDRADAAEALVSGGPARVLTASTVTRRRPVSFLFAGVGDQYVGMAAGLYRGERIFREAVDRCAAAAEPYLEGADLRHALWPAGVESGASGGIDLRAWLRREQAAGLDEPRLAQTAVFTIGYALAQLAQAWGLRPEAVLGYSLGEYTAACVAGIFTVEGAVAVVAQRASFIEAMPPGAMLAVSLGERALAPRLRPGTSIAIVNGPGMCVVSGTPDAIAGMESALTADGVVHRRVQTTRALHGPQMSGAAAALERLVAGVPRRAPAVPIVSNVTGTWLTAEQAASPEYWARHLCEPVRFDAALETLFASGDAALVEMGAGQTLGSLARQAPGGATRIVVPTLRAHFDGQDDQAVAVAGLGRLWLAGVEPDWEGFYRDERRARVPVPGYAFERARYWIDPGDQPYFAGTSRTAASGKKANIADWFYQAAWVDAPLADADRRERYDGERVLVFADAGGVAAQVAAAIDARGGACIRVEAGDRYVRHSASHYAIDPAAHEDYRLLLRDIAASGPTPATILCFRNIDPDATRPADEAAARGFHELVALAQAASSVCAASAIRLQVIARGLHARDGETSTPAQAALLGPCMVIPQEYPQISCRSIDVDLATCERPSLLAADLMSTAGDACTLYRAGTRFVQVFRPSPLAAVDPGAEVLKAGGVYLVTGGLGGVGLALADFLADRCQARLVLLARTALPARDRWQSWLDDHAADDALAVRMRRILDLERRGAEVLTVAADVSDEPAMRRIVDDIYERYGRLDGVVHAAGVTTAASFAPIQAMRAADVDVQFRPKVRGALVLERVLREREVDFCLLFSSLSAVLGGITLAAYASANAFLSAFARRDRASGRTRWIAVDWDTWKVRDQEIQDQKYHGLTTTVAQFTMTPTEGVEAFHRALCSGASRLVHSTADLDARLDQWIRRTALRAASPAVSGAAKLYARPNLATPYLAVSTQMEARVAAVWQRVLGIEHVGVHDNYFDLGGNSLLALQVTAELQRELVVPISPLQIFEAPTVRALAQALGGDGGEEKKDALAARIARRKQLAAGGANRDVAVVGMAGRFPRARNIAELWRNLRDGVDCVSTLTDEELRAAGVDEALLRHPRYVKVRPILDDIDLFDAAFFGYSPRDADLMDPQHRVLLEGAWEALEHAGYDPSRYPGSVGVFVGSNYDGYFFGLISDPDIRPTLNLFEAGLVNDRDSLATKLSYRFNLRGPSLAVQTFCSTSLVAVHLAVQSVRNGECDMALAGGVSIKVPQKTGHLAVDGGQESPDGRTRTFDSRARGTVFGDGLGLVVLKRLEDAVADGDCIHAVIKGSAINNDGSAKVSYTAPSVDGQADVISMALADAGVEPASVQYVEAHGTATELGDPIEVAALTKAFRRGTDAKQFCAIGSVKTNVGHLDRAAGSTGLIKVVLSMAHRQIPPSLHYETPNPKMDIDSSPFYVNARLAEWRTAGGPRRAGVSSLGVGGTNAHVIVEEPPAAAPADPSRPWQILALSARTPSALATTAANIADALDAMPHASLPDVAFTLQVGRRAFAHRRALLCRTLDEARELLRTSACAARGEVDLSKSPTLAFVLPEAAPAIARDLYEGEPQLRADVDRSVELLRPYARGADMLAAVLSPETAEAVDDAVHFVREYALARLLIAWGARPHLLFGRGIGELVASCLSGVLPLDVVLGLAATPPAERRALRDALAPASPQIPIAPTFAELRSGPGPRLTMAVGRGTESERADVSLSPRDGGAVIDLPTLLTGVAALWASGVDVAWSAFYGDERRRRVPLPTYPFERTRHWIEPKKKKEAPPAAAERKAARWAKDPIDDWFYVPIWKQSAQPVSAAPAGARRWLLLVDDEEMADALVTRIGARGEDWVSVACGASFEAVDERHFRIDPRASGAVARVLDEVQGSGARVTHVVHAWSLEARYADREAGLFFVVDLVQALARGGSEPVQIGIVTSGVYRVHGERVCPENALLVGPCRAVTQEYPHIGCRLIDVQSGGESAATIARLIVSELAQASGPPVVAYRGRQRWLPAAERVPLPPAGGNRAIALRDRGVYLITGGLGGIGLAIAAHLARAVRARVALVGRSPLPPRATWDAVLADPAETRLARQIRGVQAIEHVGGEVRCYAADVADRARMQEVVDDVVHRFGAIHGVIHAAGTAAGEVIAEKTAGTMRAVLRPKVDGARVLDAVLGDGPLDFLLLMSSLSSWTGTGPGQLDYCAANAYLDAVARARTRDDRPVIAVNWCEWTWNAHDKEIGNLDPQAYALMREYRQAMGITAAEGVDALERVLAAGFTEVIVSTQAFDPAERPRAAAATSASKPTAAAAPEAIGGGHPRPDLDTPYVAPTNEVESGVAAIWRELLGIERIGIDDDFFDLGGHSLLATQVFTRIEQRFDVNMSVGDIFDAPTVAAQAAMISALVWARPGAPPEAVGAASGVTGEI